MNNMAKVRAHIVFDDHKPESRARMLETVKKAVEISDINKQRFELYGLLTGTVEDSSLDKVREIPGVKGVQVDEDKFPA